MLFLTLAEFQRTVEETFSKILTFSSICRTFCRAVALEHLYQEKNFSTKIVRPETVEK